MQITKRQIELAMFALSDIGAFMYGLQAFGYHPLANLTAVNLAPWILGTFLIFALASGLDTLRQFSEDF